MKDQQQDTFPNGTILYLALLVPWSLVEIMQYSDQITTENMYLVGLQLSYNIKIDSFTPILRMYNQTLTQAHAYKHT